MACRSLLLPTRHSSDTQDVAMEQPIADVLAASYARFAADGRWTVVDIATPILDPAQAGEETLRCATATAAYKSPSGSRFPRKLELHLTLYEHNCAAHDIRGWRSRSGWLVETDRGMVVETKVVDATNALRQRSSLSFYPYKGQTDSVPPSYPSRRIADKEMFRHTDWLATEHRLELQVYSDYHRHDLQAYRDNKLQAPAIMAVHMIQRPDGMVIFSGRRGNPERTVALREALPRHFDGWPKGDLAEECMLGPGPWAITDGVPYVGPGGTAGYALYMILVSCPRITGSCYRHGPDNDLRQRAGGADAGGGSV
ncbi:hypothetical protein MSAN_02366100 [Mycena sanguinolenta]|uniref:Uncharacterized protein n=1 Tax=Mycena sanguinolenta TaxID=230812 RepID=A0A8H7CEZ1_9AGAR|nr:hypothetical protein MSAN_02366100 [Mycena sanguinolenta]